MRSWLHTSPRLILLSTLAAVLTIWAIGSVLSGAPRPLTHQPGPDALEYADGAWQLGHGHGYVMFYNEYTQEFGNREFPPRYPFGTSVALAPFAAFSSTFPGSIQTGAQLIVVLLLLASVAAAWRLGSRLSDGLGGPVAGGLAALMVGLSPFATTASQLILSDALASLLAVLMLIALTFPTLLGSVLAGLAAGAGVCVRLLSVVLLPPLVLVLKGRHRLAAVAGAVPLIALLAYYQWHAFGAPWRTGYSYWAPHLHSFSLSFLFGRTPGNEGPFVYPDKLRGGLMSWTCPCGVGGSMTNVPNWAFYPSLMIGLFWVFIPPFVGLLGLGELILRRASAPALFVITTVVLNIALVDFYYDRGARFVAPAASLVLIYSAVGGARVLAAAWRGGEVLWKTFRFGERIGV